jgi:hypothetical protein
MPRPYKPTGHSNNGTGPKKKGQLKTVAPRPKR